MRGFVTENCNERNEPLMDALITGTYNTGAMVEVIASVEGEEYDAESLWYQLSNGAYVWSGAISVMRDGSALPEEEKKQYLISYRQIDEEGRPDLDPTDPARKLYFSQLVLPANPDNVQTNELSPQEFADHVLQLVSPISEEREHVFIYIHGYHFISSLKLELLANFVQSYMTHQNNKIAKVLFFAWPAQGGLARKTVDDRSIRAGELFTANGLFDYWKVLSEALLNNGRKLNLLVHSFGHQLLNGMLNPDPAHAGKIPTTSIFQNIFLMAPDITHLSLKTGGADLYNNFPDNGKERYHYQCSKLKQLANNVHVFHDKYDYLLHVSSKKFLEKGMRREPEAAELERIREYRGLGNYGNVMLPEVVRESGFTFWNVEELIRKYADADLYDFPFRPLKKKMQKRIDRLWNNSDYGEIKFFQTLFNVGRTADHHRYVFTCKQVVDKVQELL